MKKINRFSYHHFFLIAGSVMGLFLVFINPPWQSNDEDRHFYNAYSLARGNWGPVIRNGDPGSLITSSTRDVVQYFQNIRFSDTMKLSKEKMTAMLDVENDQEEVFYPHTSATNLPFPYIPAALAIKLGDSLGASPIWLGWWGRIGSLLIYLVIVFFAIRIIPHFKAFLTVCALTPMAIYQGASVTYDSLSFALLFLLFAYPISLYFQEKPVTWKQIAFFCLLAFAQKLSKDGYFVLAFTLFALHRKRFERVYLYYLSFVLLILISILPSMLWNRHLFGLGLTNSDIQFRSDYLFDAGFHIKYHMKDPLHLIYVLVQNVFFEGKSWIMGSMGRFGFTYLSFPEWFYRLHIVMLILFVFIDQSERILSFKFRIAYFFFSFMGVSATIAGFYFYLSPIGAETFFNFQGRYLTPCIPFLFLGLFYVPHKKWDKRILIGATVIYCTFLAYYTVSYINQFYNSA